MTGRIADVIVIVIVIVETPMAQICSVCGKTSYMGVRRKLLRGHYNPTAKVRKYPNLQWFAKSGGKRVMACTKCIRSAQKTKSTKK